ncbi:MAG: C1q-like domain-containing protein [Cetobacterium sp.]
MRKQDLPAFQAKSATNQTFGAALGTVKATLGVADVNNGGHYSIATSRFTAPVGGLYVFSYNSAQSTTVSGPEVELFVNNSQRYGDLAIGYATSFMSFGGSWVVDLAANDYVELFITNNNAVTVTLSAGRSWFSGFYLG